jgi:hypothetical protein
MVAKTGKMGRSVRAALKNADVKPADAGGVELAKRYADLIDRAELLYDSALEMRPEDEVQAHKLHALEQAFEAHKVASDLGPKLLATLTALGATPAGRTPVVKGGLPNASPAARALASLRAENGPSARTHSGTARNAAAA